MMITDTINSIECLIFFALSLSFRQFRLDIICRSAKKKEPGTCSRLFFEFPDYFLMDFISNYYYIVTLPFAFRIASMPIFISY